MASTWSSVVCCHSRADTQPFFLALGQNSILYVNQTSNIHWEAALEFIASAVKMVIAMLGFGILVMSMSLRSRSYGPSFTTFGPSFTSFDDSPI
jgi:hypothetical protein